MKTHPKISLTGDLGSGKSHVSRLLSSHYGYRIVSTGSIQRQLAEKYGMSTLQLNEYTRTHPEIDDEIDGMIRTLETAAESMIFDSRLAWHFAPSSFKVYLTVDPEIAAQRVFGDSRTGEKYNNPNEAREQILARRQSELQRFREYYGIDYADLGNYDMVTDTSLSTPGEIARQIIAAFDKWIQKD